MTAAANPWRLQGNGASHESLGLLVNMTDEGAWRCESKEDGALIDVSAALPFKLIEAYERGDDFVVTNEAVEGFPFRTQFYWSAQELAEFGAVAVVVTPSLQTDQLDTRPELEFRLTADDATVSSCGRSVNVHEGRIVLAPFATDLAETELQATGSAGVARFTPPFLEKGVIRRARFALLLAAEPLGSATISGCLEALTASPLPLTT